MKHDDLLYGLIGASSFKRPSFLLFFVWYERSFFRVKGSPVFLKPGVTVRIVVGSVNYVVKVGEIFPKRWRWFYLFFVATNQKKTIRV